MKKRMFCLLASLLVLSLPSSAAQDAAYRDVPPDSALAHEVALAAEYGLMNGVGDSCFGYGQTISRGQFAMVLVRMFRWEIETPEVSVFNDETPEQYWYAHAETAAKHNVVDARGAFRGADAVTRGEMAEMLVRALGYQGVADAAAREALPFLDATDNGYIAIAYAIGMTKGTSATTFSPDATATREQAAAMMVRIYENYSQPTKWLHGFYAISSYAQIGLGETMDALSATWARMTFDGAHAALNTTSSGANEFCIPNGYDSVVNTLRKSETPLNLCVYMDTSVPCGDTSALQAMLQSESARAEAVEAIVSELSTAYKAIGENPYAGVTIDFEGLRSGTKAAYTAFIEALASRVHAMGKTLYITVQPVLSNGAYFDGYDYRALGTAADKVILMAHDYDPLDLHSFVGTTYYKNAALTPIAQVYEALRAITDSQTGVADTSRIVLAMSCKAMAWETDAAGKLTNGRPIASGTSTVYRRLQQEGSVRGWSQTYQNPYLTYTTESGQPIFLWYEDERSAASKVRLARLLGINQFSLWRLGTIPNYAEAGLDYDLMGALR